MSRHRLGLGNLPAYDAVVTDIIIAVNATRLALVWRNFEHEDRVRRDTPVNAPSVIGYRKSDGRFVGIMCGPPTLIDAGWRDELTRAGAVVIHASTPERAVDELRRTAGVSLQ